MNAVIKPSHTQGKIKAIASKSAAHRLLICAAFARGETAVRCENINDDISATVDCLCALGAEIKREGDFFKVTPAKKINKNATLDCKESGSTLRFLIPVCAALGADASFLMRGRLADRPLSPLQEELESRGVSFEKKDNMLTVTGSLEEIDISIDGGVSSQFISGLLMAIGVSGKNGRVRVTGVAASKPYIDLTADALATFGVSVTEKNGEYEISKNSGLIAAKEIAVEGDWSSAAFPLTMGVIGKGAITVTGLRPDSPQGDKNIVAVLKRMGARIEAEGDSVTAYPSELKGTEIDGENIPDLIPVLAVAAAVAQGKTVIYNAARLRIKESDRLAAISEMLNTLGANVKETEDGLEIIGKSTLCGGKVSSFHDHRIAMSAAVASLRCKEEVIVTDACAVSKSYPTFFDDAQILGLDFEKC